MGPQLLSPSCFFLPGHEVSFALSSALALCPTVPLPEVSTVVETSAGTSKSPNHKKCFLFIILLDILNNNRNTTDTKCLNMFHDLAMSLIILGALTGETEIPSVFIGLLCSLNDNAAWLTEGHCAETRATATSLTGRFLCL